MQKVEFSVKLPIKIKKKNGVCVLHCPVLDLYAQGNNESEAKKNMGETIKLFLISCYERGTLGAVLKECGFKPLKTASHLPTDQKFITVPIPFSAPGVCGTECHA